MKAERKLTRREFLKVASSLAGLGLLPSLEGEAPVVLDILPERTAAFSVLPFGNSLDAIIGNGTNPNTGYTHLQPTVDVHYQPDGGLHIGADFNRHDVEDDSGTPLDLIMDGVCVFAGDGIYRDLGKIAIFCHRLPDESLIYSRFCHMGSWNVQIGQNYRAGDLVGLMDHSGRPNGRSHLHLDIANRRGFSEKIMPDPWWYPHGPAVGEQLIQRFFVDPIEIIRTYLRQGELSRKELLMERK